MIFWAVINVAVSLFFGLCIKAPLMRAYLFLNYVLIVNPAFMWAFFDIAHPKFLAGHSSYTLAMVFMALFNIILCGTFMLLMRTLPHSKLAKRYVVAHRINYNQNIHRIILITSMLAMLGYLGKLGLDSIGALRILDVVDRGPSLQLIKILAGFDLIAIILLSELRMAIKERFSTIDVVLSAMLIVSLGFALSTGSRSQTLTVMIIGLIGYRDVVRRYKIIIFPAIAAVIPSSFLLFPLLAYYRGSNYDFTEARYLLEDTGSTIQDIMGDVVVTRLNYHESLARVIDYVQYNGPSGGTVYWNNIIGVIPRLIWPDKPEISNNSRELGHQLGLVTQNDSMTSIGLQVVGEAFFEFGWLGLWIAVFQALIFTLIHKNFFRPGNPAAMTVYIFIAFFILQRDGYFAVVPGLIWQIIGFIIFFGTFALLMNKPRRVSFHEALPSRFTHR